MSEFLAYTSELWERFQQTGPGLPTIELSNGLELLHQFQGELDIACKSREQLVLAERLFDMDITSYPNLGQLESNMKKLTQVCLCVYMCVCACTCLCVHDSLLLKHRSQ